MNIKTEQPDILDVIRDQFCDCPGHGLADDQHSPEGCQGLKIKAACLEAQKQALHDAALHMNVAVSRGDMISVIPSCHKKGCQCGGGGGSEELVVVGVANAFRNALQRRAIFLGDDSTDDGV